MLKFILTQSVIASLFLAHGNTKQFEPDMEVKINGLVCDSCGIGIKRKLKKYPTHVVEVKFNTKKQHLETTFKLEYTTNIERFYLLNSQVGSGFLFLFGRVLSSVCTSMVVVSK